MDFFEFGLKRFLAGLTVLIISVYGIIVKNCFCSSQPLTYRFSQFLVVVSGIYMLGVMVQELAFFLEDALEKLES